MRLSRRARRRWILVVALVVAGGGGALAWRAVAAAQTERLLAAARAEGLEARRRGDLDEALVRLSYYYARRKGDVEAMLAFADVRSRIPVEQGRHLIEASGLYGRVLMLDPSNREALDRQLDLTRRLGDRIESGRLAERLLALDPDHRAALATRLRDLQAAGRFDEALQVAARLAELEPDEIQWRLRTLQIMERRRAQPREMLDLADRWIAEHGATAPFLAVKARLLLVLGRRGDAADAARAAVAAGPATLPALQALLVLLDELELPDLAAEAIEHAMEALPGSSWVWQAAAQRQWQAGRHEQALGTLAQAEARLAAPDPEIARLRVLAERALGRRDDARRSIEALRAAAGSLDPDARSAWLAWSAALRADVDGGPWAARKALLDRALALRRNDAAIVAIAAEGWLAAGEPERALAALEVAARLEPGWVEPAARRAAILLDVGRASEALDTVAALLRRAPEAPGPAWLTLARAWLQTDPARADVGLLDRARGAPMDLVGLLEKLSGQEGVGGAATPLLAEAYLARGRRADAEALLDGALAAGGGGAASMLALAQVSIRGGLGREARLVEAARAAAGPTLEVAASAAWLQLRAGRTEQGLAIIDEAVEASGPSRRAEGRRLRAAYLVAAGQSGAAAALAGLLEPGPEPAAADDAAGMAVFVLSQPPAWSDPALVGRAIEVLAQNAGEDAANVRLARATLLLRDPARGEAQLAEATVLTGDVLASSPDSLAALTLMSALLMEGTAPDPAQAIAHLRRAVDLYPGRPELYPRLIDMLQDVGDFASAGPLLERLGALSGGDPALVNSELRLLQAQGDFDRAVVRLSQFVGESSPEQDQVRLARLLERSGRTADAGRIYARLLSPGPVTPATASAAADFHAAGGRIEEALGILESAAPAGDRGASARTRGSLLRRHGRPEQASLLLEEAVAADPGDAGAWLELARLRLAGADFSAARSAAEAGLAARPGDPALRSILAVASLDLDEPSLRRAVEALGDVGDDPDALDETLALLQRGLSRPGGPSPRDILDAGELARRRAGFLPAWKLCVTWLAGANRIDDAVGMASEAIARLPARPEPPEWATRVLLQAGRDDDALDMAYTWRERMGHRPFVPDMLIAELELAAGRPHLALSRLEPHEARIVAGRDGAPSRAPSLLLGALLHEGAIDRAASLLDRLAGSAGEGPAGGDDPWIDEWLGWTATAAPEIATRALDAVEPRLRKRPDGLMRLARAWAGVARRGGAEAALARADALAAEAWPGRSAQAGLSLRGRIAIEREDHAAAEEHYRALLAISADDVDALNNLAWLLSRRGEAGEAAELAGRAAQLAPGDADVMDTWAVALLGVGRLEEAEHAARRARALRGDDDAALGLTLVKVLIARGNLDEADTELTRAERQIALLPPAARRTLEPEAALLRSGILRARTAPRREHASAGP